MKNRNYDLLVIGGGILGTFHAYHALKKGLRVALLEKDTVPKAATVRNFGQIVPSGMDAKWQTMGRRSVEVYSDLSEQIGLACKKEGSVYLAHDEAEMQLLEELAAINRGNDYPSALLTAAACLKQYPGLRADYCVGGLFFPTEISLDPRLAVHQLRNYMIAQLGLDYFPATPAHAVNVKAASCLITDAFGKEYTAGHVIICAGNEFQTLYPEVYQDAGLVLCQLQMLGTQAQKQQQIPGNVLTGRTIRRYEAFRACPSYAEVKAQMDELEFGNQWGIHILFKQAADGKVILGDSHHYAAVGKKGTNMPFDRLEAVDHFMLQEAAAIFELETYEISHRWLGYYTQCAEADIFTKTIEERVHLVAGIGGKGMTAGPGFAEQHLQKLLLN